MNIRPIRTPSDYEWALKQVARYFENEPVEGSSDSDRFEILTVLINVYEQRHFPIEAPNALEVVRFYLEQNALGQADLARVLGSRSRASEFLSGKRNLTLAMISAIHEAWGISANLLLPSKLAA